MNEIIARLEAVLADQNKRIAMMQAALTPQHKPSKPTTQQRKGPHHGQDYTN